MTRDEDEYPKEKEYKPVMVFYFNKQDKTTFSDMYDLQVMSKISADKCGYENSLCLFEEGIQSRVEIISVDKATVVEDIQKYIDDKYLK